MAENTKPMTECVLSPKVNGMMPLDSLPLAMGYVPVQKWENLYDPETALDRGTLFCCLDLPFCGKEA